MKRREQVLAREDAFGVAILRHDGQQRAVLGGGELHLHREAIEGQQGFRVGHGRHGKPRVCRLQTAGPVLTIEAGRTDA